jgi:TonB family protein
MAKEKKEKHFVQKPIYPGGPQALRAFVTQNLRYPKGALKERAEGTVVIRYTINHKGAVTDTKVISSLHKDCDAEAVRLVKLLKFRVPKQKRPGKIQFHKSIKIHFKPPKPQSAQKKANIAYEVVPGPDQEAEKEKGKGGGGYSYTISF